MVRTSRPAHADFSTTRVERLFPHISKYCSLTASNTISQLLGSAIPAHAGKVRICPHGDINIDFGVDATANSSLLKANNVYEIEGYKTMLDNVALYGAGGTVNVSVIVYVDDTVEEQFESSSSMSSASSNSSSSESISSVSSNSSSSKSISSASSNSSSSSTQSSASSASSNSSSSSTDESASSDSSEIESRSSASTDSTGSSSSESSLIN